jgi:hypothetical protein
VSKSLTDNLQKSKQHKRVMKSVLISDAVLLSELIRLLIVVCGMFGFNGCAKLLDIGRNWNMLSYMSIQSIPNMLNGGHVW